MASAASVVGSVVSLWRYPVKSMMGEELNATNIAEQGLLGDRTYALVDSATGKIVSAKNPRKWSNLFDFRAALVEPPATGNQYPVQITLPDGTLILSEAEDTNQVLSTALGRDVKLETAAPAQPSLEEYWPDIEGLPHRETVTDEYIAAGSFFDLATVHVLTTATIERLQELSPPGRFETRRFRPNIVIESTAGEKEFVENSWIGRTLVIGEEIRLSITGPCPRCVMTTLPQGDLPNDPSILRTAVQYNQGNVGIYASVLRGGTIRRGDVVRVE